MVSAAAFINNVYRFECLVDGFQDKAVYTAVLGTVYESMGELSQKLTNRIQPKGTRLILHCK